jgi:hypothetical protein
MSGSESNNNIIIRFEVQIPQSAASQAPILIQGAEAAKSSSAGPAASSSPTSPQPIAGREAAQVKTESPAMPAAQAAPIAATPLAAMAPSIPTTASFAVDQPTNPAKVDPAGNICVTASNDFCPDGHEPTAVFIKVMEPGDPIPASPPTGTPPVGATPAIITSPGTWHHLQVGGAKSLPPGTGVVLPWNQIVIWREFSCEPGVWFIEVLNRQGESSTGTNCTFSVAPTFETVAESWIVPISGFAGEGLEVFNRAFDLLRDTSAAHGCLSWMSEGDGVRQPRAELVGHSCRGAIEFRLLHAGRRVSYVIPRSQWNPVGMNSFRLHSRTGIPGQASIPTAVAILPG